MKQNRLTLPVVVLAVLVAVGLTSALPVSADSDLVTMRVIAQADEFGDGGYLREGCDQFFGPRDMLAGLRQPVEPKRIRINEAGNPTQVFFDGFVRQRTWFGKRQRNVAFELPANVSAVEVHLVQPDELGRWVCPNTNMSRFYSASEFRGRRPTMKIRLWQKP